MAQFDASRLALLTENGFRRSGDYIYRPHCKQCRDCESLRIPAARFSPSRSQKRIIRKNSDLHVSMHKAVFKQEHYQLYQAYIDSRHHNGDMYPASEAQYRSFLLSDFETARFIEFRNPGNKLIAVSVIDILPDALSAIYTFFDPLQTTRSPGSYAILWQLDFCKTEHLTHLYLGYYIPDSQKMAYKNKYKPHQLYQNEQWLDME
jgi:arginine-tRNA-protein transferase